MNKGWEQKADTNADGRVDTTEMDAWGEAHGNADRTVDKDWAVQADTNGDGKISQGEARRYNSTMPSVPN